MGVALFHFVIYAQIEEWSYLKSGPQPHSFAAPCVYLSAMLLVLFYTLIFVLVNNTRALPEPVHNLTDWPLECYGAQLVQVKPTNLKDCREMAVGIVSLPPWGRPWTFSNEPGHKADRHIPIGIKHRSCYLRIVPVEDTAKVSDTFTPRYLAHQIYRTINECVIPWPHLGGEGEIGPKKVLALTLSGPLDRGSVDSGDELTITQINTQGNYDILLANASQKSTSQS